MNKKYEKDKEEFLNKITKNKHMYEAIFNDIEELNIDIYNFNNNDLEILLSYIGSISLNSLNKSLQIIREIVYYFNPKNEKLMPNKKMENYIDYDKLFSKTIIFPGHYDYIKDWLKIAAQKDGNLNEYNFRDAVIFDLACEGLTNKEIKNLKMKNIHFFRENSKNKCRLDLITNRSIVLDNEEIVFDIKKCMQEIYYLRIEKTGKYMFVPYRDTPYLIRPVQMHQGKNLTVADPNSILGNKLKKLENIPVKNINNDIEYYINLNNLSLEDLRRSKILYLIGEFDAKITDLQYLLSKKTEHDLHWLKKIAKILYNKNS